MDTQLLHNYSINDAVSLEKLIHSCSSQPKKLMSQIADRSWELFDQLMEQVIVLSKSREFAKWKVGAFKLVEIIATCVRGREAYLMAVEKMSNFTHIVALELQLCLLWKALVSENDINVHCSGMALAVNAVKRIVSNYNPDENEQEGENEPVQYIAAVVLIKYFKCLQLRINSWPISTHSNFFGQLPVGAKGSKAHHMQVSFILRGIESCIVKVSTSIHRRQLLNFVAQLLFSYDHIDFPFLVNHFERVRYYNFRESKLFSTYCRAIATKAYRPKSSNKLPPDFIKAFTRRLLSREVDLSISDIDFDSVRFIGWHDAIEECGVLNVKSDASDKSYSDISDGRHSRAFWDDRFQPNDNQLLHSGLYSLPLTGIAAILSHSILSCVSGEGLVILSSVPQVYSVSYLYQSVVPALMVVLRIPTLATAEALELFQLVGFTNTFVYSLCPLKDLFSPVLSSGISIEDGLRLAGSSCQANLPIRCVMKPLCASFSDGRSLVALCSSLLSAMHASLDDGLRENAMVAFRKFLFNFNEVPRFLLLKHLITQCPHLGVKGLLIDCSKDSIQAAYTSHSTSSASGVDNPLIAGERNDFLGVTQESLEQQFKHFVEDGTSSVSVLKGHDGDSEELSKLEVALYHSSRQRRWSPFWSMQYVNHILVPSLAHDGSGDEMNVEEIPKYSAVVNALQALALKLSGLLSTLLVQDGTITTQQRKSLEALSLFTLSATNGPPCLSDGSDCTTIIAEIIAYLGTCGTNQFQESQLATWNGLHDKLAKGFTKLLAPVDGMLVELMKLVRSPSRSSGSSRVKRQETNSLSAELLEYNVQFVRSLKVFSG